MPFDTSQDSHIALKKVISERTSPIIGWVGAGLSAPAGLPSWEGLLDDLIAVLKRKLATITTTPKSKGLATLLIEERRKKNYWLCFQLIEELLGTTSYQSEIRERLDTASHSAIPTGYGALWKAGIQGLVTFNLDQFATRSFSLASPGANVDLFVGSQAKNMLGVLQRSRPFIGNVHGIVDDASSWIFTHDKLQALLKNNGYRQFINACLLTRTYRDFPFRQQRLIDLLPDRRYSLSLLADARWIQKPPQKDRLHIYRRACVGQMVRCPRYEPLGRTPFVPRA